MLHKHSQRETGVLLFAALSLTIDSACVVASPGVSAHASVLQTFGGRPLIDVSIDGKGPFRFILDTGAAHTILDAGLADDLGLTRVGQDAIKSPLGSEEMIADVVLAREMIAGGVPLGDREIVIFDLAGFIPAPDPPRGVISYRDLTGHLVVLDFPAEELRLPAGVLPEPNGRDVFAFDGDIPEISVKLGDREERLHLDTGSVGGFTVPLAWASDLPLNGQPVVVGRGATVDAAFDILAATLQGEVAIGALRFDHPTIEFIDGAPVGNVGMRTLAGLVLTLDPANRRVRLEAGPEGGAVQRAVAKKPKRYGIRFTAITGEPLAVMGVDPDSPAARGGLRVGDEITAMNGLPLGELSQAERIAALRASPLSVTIARAGRT